MAVPEIISALQATTVAGYIRGDSPGGEWAFPIIETLHVMALACVYGTIVMVDLRMLGITSRSERMSRLSAEVLPWTWTAFICAAITGSLLFISKAEAYWGNFEFRSKFLCLALAGLNMAIYQLGLHRRVSQWDLTLPPPLAARVAGALSISLWTAVVFFGRWIGFTT